jgi:quinol-cytochrome oxidoreductase complex cytochrome b subunit
MQIPGIKLPIRSARGDLSSLPRELMIGIVIAIMGMVSVVIGTVLFGSTTGIGAYIDRVFQGMGVQSNITLTIRSYNFPAIFNLFGIAMLIVGFVIILLALLNIGKEAQTIWK